MEATADAVRVTSGAFYKKADGQVASGMVALSWRAEDPEAVIFAMTNQTDKTKAMVAIAVDLLAVGMTVPEGRKAGEAGYVTVCRPGMDVGGGQATLVTVQMKDGPMEVRMPTAAPLRFLEAVNSRLGNPVAEAARRVDFDGWAEALWTAEHPDHREDPKAP
jgi:hypothetical protein